MSNYDKLAKIAMHKSLLKEFHNNENGRIVYLNDGDEFQIQIFNPYDYVIGVGFTFNSDNIDNSKLLVLKPGERVWLDRYLDENKKLLFSTYEVSGKSKEVKKAIQKNGIVNIYFYREKYENGLKVFTTPGYVAANIFYNHSNPNDSTYYCDTTINTICGPGTMKDNIDANYTNINNYCHVDNELQSLSDKLSLEQGVSAAATANTSATYTSYSAATSTIKNGTNSCVNYNKKSIETGRVDKGSYSYQHFNNYYGDFESWYFKKETIKILPQSQKQISSKDLNKKYCHNCGRKIKESFKFCPNCGTEQ